MRDAPRNIRCIAWAGRVRSANHTISIVAMVFAASALAIFLSTAEDVVNRDGIVRRDPGFLRLFTHLRTTPVVDAAKVVTDFGSVLVLGLVAVVSGYILWRKGYHLGHALAPSVAFVMSMVTVGVVKGVIDRHRPPASMHLVAESDPSFPSGHATDSAAVLLTIALVVAVVTLRRPLARIGTVLIAGVLVTSIGLSRLVLGVHWPTDVVAGWALGSGIALVVLIASMVVTRPSSALAPGTPGRLERLHFRLSRLFARQRPVTP